MQWRRQRRVTHVIGSSNHVLLLARYQDAPPGEEDEEEGLRNWYVKGRENDTSTHGYSRNGQGDYKPRRSGYGDAGTRSHKDESSGSPSQPKIIFNEDEYTRITTPRQDMLFKKGYLSKKKPWAGNANTSATSSTTGSQSASHSTADGSETTEDQQLLDRDSGSGEYPPMMEPGAQLGYGTFYDHASGYYYEYPVMLVGPAPVPAQVAPGVLTTVPCGPVPLRPIEWINPTFVPKLAEQPYYMVDYETNQGPETAVVTEEPEDTVPPVETSNGTCNESGTGSASCSGSVAGEVEEQATEANPVEDEQQADKQNEEQIEEYYVDEQHVEEQHLENGMNGGPYMEPVLMQQPVHVSHVIPAVPQPYMYPGHYMFGPPLINVNGVTIQGGPMIRTTDVAAMSAACAKRRKKKKRRKQRRLATGNMEGNTDEEEGEYSSECDTGLPSSRLSWTACSTSTTTTTTTNNRPLNPECKEFKLRQVVEPNTSLSTIASNSEENSINQSNVLLSDATTADNESNEVCNGVVSDDSNNQTDDKPIVNNNSDEAGSSTSSLSLEKSESTSPDATNPSNEANRLIKCLSDEEEAKRSTNMDAPEATLQMDRLPNNVNDNESANDKELCERPSNEMNGINERTLVNGKMNSDSNNEDTPATATKPRPSSPCNDERVRSTSITPKTVPMENGGIREENHASLLNSKSSSSSLPKRKYSAKGAKFVREPTPGPDLDSTAEPENETKVLSNDLNDLSLEKTNDSKPDSMFNRCNDNTEDDQTSKKFASENGCNHLSKEDPIEASNEDSGFESQTRLSDYPITDAVTDWLRRANSPDIFITSNVSVDSETEDEDDVDEEQSKNLQGNPMPALSANSGVADNASLSRTTSCSEFARVGNVKGQEQLESSNNNNNNAGGSRKKRDAKKRSGERRRVTRLDHEVVSSSDSCGQLEDPVNNVRRKNNPSRQQDNVGEVCEFTEKDSVAGMRVAENSRINSKRANGRRTKRQGKCANSIDTKNRRVKDENEEIDEGIVEDTMNVRTFEKGEIVVSEEGKLLTTSIYEPILRNRNDASAVIKAIGKSETVLETTTKKTEERKRNSSGEEKNCSGIISLDSIEEPDVLEYWEAETIEPVITPKKMLQCEGILCEGEAAEDDSVEVEQVNIDYVQKYYRLARESVEEETNGSKANAESSASSKSVPNKFERMIEIATQSGDLVGDKNAPIDEAFEVYESCYTGKAPFLSMDSKIFKSRTLYGQDGEHPIPCRAVCCNIQ